MSSELECRLRKIGFSMYEAKAYSSLLILCNSTMKELSDKSGIPYQKVYEVVRSLENKGLVRVIQGRPKRVKLLDPSISLKIYKEKIISELDDAISYIVSLWGEKRKEEVDRSLHVKGKRTIIRLIKEFSEKSTKMRVVYDIIPEWLIKILKQYKGKLIVVTATRDLDISGEVKFVDNIRSKFIVFDDSLVVTFNNGDEEAVIDSCKGCVIQAEEHFELLTSKGE